MIRRMASYRFGKPAARDRQPGDNRAFHFIVVTLAAGAIAAILAVLIAGAPALLVLAFPTNSEPPINAAALFPNPSPTVKVIDVYDPPKYVAPRPPASSQPQPQPQPTEPPEPGDGGGGVGGDN